MSSKNNTRAVLIEEPRIQNTVNMNLTHDDVINVAIQTQLQNLEPLEEEIQQKILAIKNQIKQAHQEVIERATLKAELYPEVKTFKKALDYLGGKDKAEISFLERHPAQQLTEVIVSEPFLTYEGCDPDQYKNPMRHFKSNSRNTQSKENIAKSINIRLQGRVNGIIIAMEKSCVIILTEKEYQSYKKHIQNLVNEKAKMMAALYDVKKKILELRYDEKKVKAAVVKQSLSQSEQGRQILNLLEKSVGIKLLGS